MVSVCIHLIHMRIFIRVKDILNGQSDANEWFYGVGMRMCNMEFSSGEWDEYFYEGKGQEF